MLRRLHSILAVPDDHPQGGLLSVYLLTMVGAVFGGIYLGMPALMAIPGMVAVVWLSAMDIRKTFLLMLVSIPLSMELDLPGGFATDLPSEQFMWLLTLVGSGWFLRNWRTVDTQFLRHPITLALLAHLAWIVITTITSQHLYISFKYLLAKVWYLIVLYFLAARFLQEERDFKNLLWCFFLPLLFAVLTVIVRHAARGFSFEEVGYVMGPFFRNHVMYACLLAVFLPFVWYGTYWYRRWSGKWLLLVLGILVLLVGINFAYTRAAYVALVGAIGIYWVVRYRLLKAALVAVAFVVVMFVGFVGTRDNWLQFTPNYERTVTHKRFDRLLDATIKLEDISTMERVYRWVAASYMMQERPYTGFGPATFYTFYKNYTVTSFKTYVSDNPERSGIHNYFLMVAVEQGLPGLVIFLLFCVIVMLKGERIYHRTKEAWKRRVLLASLLCFMLTLLLMLMNDLLETDKIGALFFMSTAILVNMDLQSRDNKALSSAST
ncbi:MAG: O-antigen ligase family protein [Saprospiraceae bacterium]|nr:O-antigen ligase family protein [Saprospiraceae bacterium]